MRYIGTRFAYSKNILKYVRTRKCKFYRYNKEKFLLFQDKEIFLVILNKEDFLVILDNEDTQDKEMAFVNHLLAKRGLTVDRLKCSSKKENLE